MDPTFVAAVARHLAGEKVNVSRFCREHGVHRDTFYKYVKRLESEGVDGFVPRSRAAHHHPNRITPATAEAVLRARKELDDEGFANGPISIMWRLEDEGHDPVPSRNSIYRILCDHGVITPQRRGKPRSGHRFEFPNPNGAWQIDGTDFTLAGGEVVCILQLEDDHSRLDVGSFAAPGEDCEHAWQALQKAFLVHGVPVILLSDNGMAFSGKRRGFMVELERRLAEVGVQPIVSSVGHPQTCGKNERMHQTMLRWLNKKPRPATLPELQVLLEQFRVAYNNHRHQGIGGQTPQQRYDARDKADPPTGPRMPRGVTERKVWSTGVIAFSGCSIPLGRQWAGHTARVWWHGDRVSVMIDNHLARELTLDPAVRYQRLPNQNCRR